MLSLSIVLYKYNTKVSPGKGRSEAKDNHGHSWTLRVSHQGKGRRTGAHAG